VAKLLNALPQIRMRSEQFSSTYVLIEAPFPVSMSGAIVGE
jgi:hypothetical protein